MDPFLNPSYIVALFTFAILQVSGKLPNVNEKMHNSLIVFAKICALSFKHFPKI